MSAWQPLETFDNAFNELKLAWDTVSNGWNDDVHEKFTSQHWSKIESETQSFRRAIDELVQVLTDARSSVSME